jgi:hypothetical protein
MKGIVALGLIAFMIGLGVMVGSRMSSEATAVVVGVVCGVLAGIPTSVLMMIAMRAFDRRGAPRQPAHHPPQSYPPVIVVTPGGQPLWPAAQSPPSIDDFRLSIDDLDRDTQRILDSKSTVGSGSRTARTGLNHQSSIINHQSGQGDAGAVDGAWRVLSPPRREFRVIGEDDYTERKSNG